MLKECKKCKNIGVYVSPKGLVSPYCPECNRERVRAWYFKNRDSQIRKTKEYQKSTNYASEKTPEQRKIRYIKRETRRKYPLGKKQCKYCNEIATEHHHTTKPITIHDFEYVCHQHHIQAERQL